MDNAPKIQISDQILWIDETILVVNKPAGMLTIRDGYNPALPYLMEILSREFGRLWVVHRLDRDTSGILIVAKTAEAHQNLNHQFEHRKVTKTYHAIVVGVPDQDHFMIDLPLKVNGDRRHRTISNERSGKNAETEFIVLEKYRGFCLIEAHPKTGYTHQIRAHLLAAGYPLLSDPLYKLRIEDKPGHGVNEDDHPDNTLISRMALHARSIAFMHPASEQLLEIQAPYPPDFDNAIGQLRGQI